MFRKNALPIVQPDGKLPARGRQWWRSLEELANTPEFQEYLHREFPENAGEWLAGSRRDFLRLMGASLFLAGVAGCDIKQPMEKIVPSVQSTDRAQPGLPLYFTTAMDFAGSALGLTVESRDGRPIKIEGNSNHPASMGTTGVFAQAATLDLYDPDRARTPLRKGQITTNQQLVTELESLRQSLDASGGEGLRLLLGTTTSPTLERLLQSMTERWPNSKWYVYESVNDDRIRDGLRLAYGDEAHARSLVYDFSNADVVLSIDCDFLSARNLPPCYVRQFADARRIAGQESESRVGPNSMIRLYHLGPTPTPTAAKADHNLALAPAGIVQVVRELASQLGVELPGDSVTSGEQYDRRKTWISQVVADLKAAGPRTLVVTGRDQPPVVHALTHAINEQLESVGQSVRYIDTPQVRPAGAVSDIEMLAQLTEEMQAGAVKSLLILGNNPAFDAPTDIEFRTALSQIEFSLTWAASANETSAATQWLVPRSHFLEGWGDARAFDGTASIIQPLISPLYESFTDIELLAVLLEDAPTGYAAVRKTWSDLLGQDENSLPWQQAVAKGVIEETAANGVSLALRAADDFNRMLNEAEIADAPSTAQKTDRFEIVFKPDPTVWDGRFLNNGWLQELPKPLSHVVWDNPAWISPADAERRQWKNGDVVEIGEQHNTVSVPIWIVPGHAEGCLTLFTGYGRSTVGRVGQGTGFNVQPLRTKNAAYQTNLPVRQTNRTHSIVTTQHHQVMEGRDLARAGNLAEYLELPGMPGFAHPASPAPDDTFYEDWPYEHTNKWGMTIDLTACVGCSACVIACQAENNIPVVGKEQCGVNRHMHWIRVDTYYQGPPEQPDRTLNQPVPCMQCERAPCEVVCPVAATNHSDDGLNQMIYNRCVGTRYCSNNCPYKVRRFNFLDFSDNFITDPSLHLLSNPEVTMRSRGVMEKCTYCIQRIEHARIGAQLANREIRDGEIKTACQAVCPAQAIRFGDLNDAQSRVRATRDHPLNYALLEELNTKPRTTYLAEVFNPTAERSKFSEGKVPE
jgi:molybdopterin-containing oxidoreductase family iron-sulfur binding subunit